MSFQSRPRLHSRKPQLRERPGLPGSFPRGPGWLNSFLCISILLPGPKGWGCQLCQGFPMSRWRPRSAAAGNLLNISPLHRGSLLSPACPAVRGIPRPPEPPPGSGMTLEACKLCHIARAKSQAPRPTLIPKAAPRATAGGPITYPNRCLQRTHCRSFGPGGIYFPHAAPCFNLAAGEAETGQGPDHQRTWTLPPPEAGIFPPTVWEAIWLHFA